MQNTIKYSTTGVTNTIKKGNFHLGVNSVGYGPTSSTGFWNTIEPPLSGYTVYGNKNDNYGPSIIVLNSDSELINWTISMGATGITTIYNALSWINSNNEMLVTNKDYEDVVTSGLILNLDAGFVPSYPKSGTTWYDVSGNGNDGILVNGPTFNQNYDGGIVFDGSNDIINLTTINLSGNFTINQTLKLAPTGNGPMPIGGGFYSSGSTYRGYIWFRNSTNTIVFNVNGEVGTTFNVDSSKWANKKISYSVTRSGNLGKLYINGVEEGSSTMSTNDFTIRTIGASYNYPAYNCNGTIFNTKIYNRVLSYSEVIQNYLANFYQFTNNLENRVKSDNGTLEDYNNNTTNILSDISILDKASWVLTPTAYNEDKLYAVVPMDGSGDLTVTRATTATRVNSNGYIETVPYNLLNYSEDFANNYWYKTPGIINVSSNIIAAPDGSFTADEITGARALTADEIRTNSLIAAKSGQTYTWSAYVKSAGNRYCRLIAWSNDDPSTTFDLDTISIISETGPSHTSAIIDVGNGWRRISITRTISFTSVWFRLYPNSSIFSETGGIYLWGAQIVEGTESKEYQSTIDGLDIPRIDYPYTGSSPSILLEPQRINRFNWSEQFEYTNGYWYYTLGELSTNQTTSPNRTLTADLFTKTSTANTVSQIFTLNPPYNTTGNHTLSVFIKPNIGETVLLRLDNVGNTANSLFNFTTKTFTNSGDNFLYSYYQELPNNWYRLHLSGNVTSTGWTASVCNLFSNPLNDSMYVWGAQLEVGTYPTSYIPTTTTTVTRNADVIKNTNISHLTGIDETYFYVDFIFKDSTNVNGFDLYTDINSKLSIRRNQVFSRVNGVEDFNYGWDLNVNTRYKILVKFKSNDIAVFLNGVKITTDTSCVYMKHDKIALNVDGSIGNYALVNSVLLFSTPISDTEAITLTTL